MSTLAEVREITPWPDPNDYCEGKDSLYEESQQCLSYERARAEAALTRLRLLANAAGVVCKNTNEAYGIQVLRNALAAIGELPA